jgi:hypothetical protein
MHNRTQPTHTQHVIEYWSMTLWLRRQLR